MNWEPIWSFRTKRFQIVLECEPEPDPDLSWADKETLDKLECGVYVNVTFRMRVLCDGREVGWDYLGNSVYADVSDFATEHRRLAAKSRADGVIYGSYFPGMVRRAIGEARKALCNSPRLRCGGRVAA